MCNEGELLEKFNIQLSPVPMTELVQNVNKAKEENAGRSLRRLYANEYGHPRHRGRALQCSRYESCDRNDGKEIRLQRRCYSVLERPSG